MKACTGDFPKVDRAAGCRSERAKVHCQCRTLPVLARHAGASSEARLHRIRCPLPVADSADWLHRFPVMPCRHDDELYQEQILDHYEEPFHRGTCPAATHAHEDENPLCGDVVRVELAIDARRHDSRRLLRRRRLLHQPGVGLDADRAHRRQARGRGQAVHRRRTCSSCSAPS